MEKEKSQGLQSVFLNHIRKGAVPSTIFLINGVKLQGIITWFDNFSILLRRDNHVQMVYKHAISTIMPAVPVNLYLKDENGNAETIEHKVEEDNSNSPKNVENIVT